MDWDNEYDNMDYISHREESIPDKSTEGGLDPMDISDPVSAYLFLSEDAQDEISGRGKKRMKWLSCGHIFVGEIYGRCLECFNPDTEDVADKKDHGYR